ncbi:hypothetical protein KNE206_52960 [Kitasatospora sp. NE20-6]|uniref:hypothetical protein n=1 Tax=Kitasatospora sp. NE20-6 TaxID=2859066 RepID=UPI0034DC9363
MSDLGGSSLRDRLNHLFATRHPKGRGAWTNAEVAAMTAEHARATGNPSAEISASLIQKLRTGAKDNPTAATLRAMARVFGVRASYFIDDDEPLLLQEASPAATPEQIQALLRDHSALALAVRTNGLSEAGLGFVSAVIEHARSMEGLPNEDRPALQPPPALP